MKRRTTRSRAKWRWDGDLERHQRECDTILFACLYIGESRLGIEGCVVDDSETQSEHDELGAAFARLRENVTAWDGSAAIADALTGQVAIEFIMPECIVDGLAHLDLSPVRAGLGRSRVHPRQMIQDPAPRHSDILIVTCAIEPLVRDGNSFVPTRFYHQRR